MIINNILLSEKVNFMEYKLSKYFKETPLIVFEIIKNYPYGKN